MGDDDNGELVRTRSDKSDDVMDIGDDELGKDGAALHTPVCAVAWAAVEEDVATAASALGRVSSKLCELDITSFSDGASVTAAAPELIADNPALQHQAPLHSSATRLYGLSMAG